MKDPIVGIDLGTTNSLVAICDERGPRVLVDDQGRVLLPSVVRYVRDEAVRLADGSAAIRAIVGHEAKEAAVLHPRATISSVKRLMGRSRADAAGDIAYLSYEVVEGEHETARVRVPLGGGGGDETRVYSPQEVSATILARLREIASRALGVPVRRAVVTVPAYFDDAQRQATRDAGRLAGLEVVRIVNEPTAAALAYGLSLARSAPRNDAASGDTIGTIGQGAVVVYDLGGGTFDVSVLRLAEIAGGASAGGRDAFQVVSTAGDTHLGGDDIDHLLVALFKREIAGVLGLSPVADLDLDPATRKQLVQFAEGVKVRLSERDSAAISIDLGEGRVYARTISRGELETMIAPLVDRTIDACRRVMRDARLLTPEGRPVPNAVGVVVMVGGSTRIPLVRRLVHEFFGVEPYTALNPDLVVALGAGVQASILSGENKSALLLDVIPLSLGVETVGGAVAKLIVRNSPVPARATEMFSTSVDNQTSIKLNILQGEREMAGDCRSLGEFHLRGIPPMPAGIPQVEVAFLVDANGVLNVSAVERRSGARASLQVVPNHGLTAEEVDRIERESFAFAREDMVRHRVVDLVASGKLAIKWIGESLAIAGPVLDPAYRNDLREKMNALAAQVAAAEWDWRTVNADDLAKAKSSLEQSAMRLQEIAITRSLQK